MAGMGWRNGISGTLLRDGLVAGLTATTTMNLGYWIERRVRRNVDGPLDYDDSNVPALVAAKILRRSDLSDQASFRLGLLVHWGYGSLFGLGAVPLNRRFGPVGATAIYWGGMMAMACGMFPLLGDTPPPWRWRNDVIATSAGQHLVYAATTTAVLRAFTRRQADVTLAGDEAGVTPEVVGAIDVYGAASAGEESGAAEASGVSGGTESSGTAGDLA
jgi:hypothetical protein